jgi:outer membrane protein TolC
MLLIVSVVSAIDLSIQEAVEIAKSAAPEMHLQKLALEKSRQELSDAKTQRLPVISLQTGTSLLIDPPEGFTLEAGSFPLDLSSLGMTEPLLIPQEDTALGKARNTYFTFSASLIQPLFTWGKINKSIQIASLDQYHAAASLREAENEIALNVYRIYFGAVLARETAKMLTEAEKIMAESLHDKETSLDAGVIKREDLLETAYRRQQVVAARVRSAGEYKQAVDRLRFYLDLDKNEIELVSDFRNPFPPADTAGQIEMAIIDSPLLEKLEIQKRIALIAEEVRKAGGNYKPDLALNISVDVTGQHIPFEEKDWIDTWDYGVVLSLGTNTRLFDGGSARWKKRIAATDKKMISTSLRSATENLELHLNSLYIQGEGLNALVKEKQALVDFAKERYKNAEISFDNDFITREKKQSAQLFLINAEIDLIRARFDHEMVYSEIDVLCGENK